MGPSTCVQLPSVLQTRHHKPDLNFFNYIVMDPPCYYYEEFHVTQGSLDPSVDCTYVLIMHGSPRKQQIYQNIVKSNLTTNVVFQYNYGYKKCDKDLRKRGPNYDLEDANKKAFKHALDRGYKRILLLEDDCEFDERVRDPKVIEDLNSFLIEKNPSIYSLGTTFSLSSPIDIVTQKKHHLLLYNSAAHAVLYNEDYMRYAIDTDFMLGHSDFETNRHTSKYTYHKPVAYQKVEETENAREGWGYVWPILNNLIVKPTGIDKQVQPGYDIMKTGNDILVLLCSTLIIVAIFLRFK
jgi:hypothetical protein